MNKRTFYKERKINKRCIHFLSKQKYKSSTNSGHVWPNLDGTLTWSNLLLRRLNFKNELVEPRNNKKKNLTWVFSKIHIHNCEILFNYICR